MTVVPLFRYGTSILKVDAFFMFNEDTLKYTATVAYISSDLQNTIMLMQCELNCESTPSITDCGTSIAILNLFDRPAYRNELDEESTVHFKLFNQCLYLVVESK